MATGSDNEELDKDDVNIDNQNDDLQDDKKDDKKKELTDEEKLEALVDARLKTIKEKLDAAYTARDTAVEEAKALKQKERDAELKKLEDEGKVKEAFEGRLADSEARAASAEKRVVELTRNLELKTVLGSFNFRNDRARDMAFQEIVGTLVQDDKGVWQHKDGSTIRQAVKKFSEDETNAFLFKGKTSTGSGGDSGKPSTTKTAETSLFKMGQAAVIQAAKEGKLPKRK